MPRGSKPGERRGGRKKGTPNKVTSAQREAFLVTFDRLQPDFEAWIRRGAEGDLQPLVVKGIPIMDAENNPVMVRSGADPLRAAAIIVQMAEYHLPKLGRTEVTGPEGGPVEYVIRDVAKGG
jgi:hypothetical protein